MSRGTRLSFLLVTLSIQLALQSETLLAYVGPGAGIAFVSSFFIVFLTLALAFVTLLTWPFRWAFQAFRRRKILQKSRVRRVVIVGLDGQDPELTEKFMQEGLLPNFQRLAEIGSYHRLGTTLPAESPVAWSSFQTGCNPGRHRVFDFLTPNRKTYLPELCSAEVMAPSRRLRLGKYELPLGRPNISFGRKSQSFWKILGDHGIFSTVLRVPISFPAEKFYGTLLSAMSVPDLKGTQGTFTYYTTDPPTEANLTGGYIVPVEVRNGVVRSVISGPPSPVHADGRDLEVPFEITVNGGSTSAVLRLQKNTYPLNIREYSPWIPVKFPSAPGFTVSGMVRFYLIEAGASFRLYMSPVNIDPEKPALPISHPLTYSIYLSKTQGRFCTLGLAEDTWALNERVLDEQAFLDQAYEIHRERERMLLDAIDKTRYGNVVCVFDITDRVQHMFFRYLDPSHPANSGKDTTVHRQAVRDLYQKMDELVGKLLEKLDDDTILFVMSDHGFKPFKRGVNLNTWLYQNGYLKLKDSPAGGEWFSDVDWAKTRAYAVGLGGIYLNIVGRESLGQVEPGEQASSLKKEICGKLEPLLDDKSGNRALGRVYDTAECYQGPYKAEGPDLIVGFNPGYRVSWSCAKGVITEEIFEDNDKSWSGDHCMNPPSVPGILFCNRAVGTEKPSILDIGPTVLDLFGVPVPDYCDGKSLMPLPETPGQGGRSDGPRKVDSDLPQEEHRDAR